MKMSYTLDGNDKFYKRLRDAGLSTNPGRNFDLQAYLDAGVISKDDLVDGCYYQGDGRGTDFAQWSTKDNCFWYMCNANPGAPMKRSVPHMADYDRYDFFMPFKKLNDKDVKDGDIVK